MGLYPLGLAPCIENYGEWCAPLLARLRRETGHGPDGTRHMIGVARAALPGLSLRLSSPVEAHHDVLRFSRMLGPDADTAVAGVTDVVILDDGRMRQIIGFIGAPRRLIQFKRTPPLRGQERRRGVALFSPRSSGSRPGCVR